MVWKAPSLSTIYIIARFRQLGNRQNSRKNDVKFRQLGIAIAGVKHIPRVPWRYDESNLGVEMANWCAIMDCSFLLIYKYTGLA
nr:MAG TPA: hypothetical protein [Caudoviricetes sp.]